MSATTLEQPSAQPWLTDEHMAKLNEQTRQIREAREAAELERLVAGFPQRNYKPGDVPALRECENYFDWLNLRQLEKFGRHV